MNLLFWSSFLCIPTGIYCYRLFKYDISFMIFCVFCTSINFHRNAIPGFRRNLDIVTVVCSGVYQNVYWIKHKIDPRIYLMLNGVGISYYFVSNTLKDDRFHALFHIFANLANIALVNG